MTKDLKRRRPQPSAETKATKALQRAGMAEKVWSEDEVQNVVITEKAARLKALGSSHKA